MSALELSAVGLGAGIWIMLLAWLLAAHWNFYSLVDVAWSYGIGLIALIYGVLGTGAVGRRILLVVLAGIWSVRLGTHLALRLAEMFPEEDRRYEKIRTSWGASTRKNFFWFFQSQAVSMPILCIPFAWAAASESPFHIFDLLAVIVCVLGVVGESAADSQLKHFKAAPKNAGQLCNVGLWRYSRHPNYFFEWIIWCGFACLGLLGTWGFACLAAPILMFFLLNFVTGVPPAEAQSLWSKGEAYRQYQRQTSRFFPWFPK